MVDGFLEKNKDKLPGQLVELCDTSSAPMMKVIFGNAKQEDAGSSGAGGGRSSSRGTKPALKTIAGKFKKQLSSLAHTLSITSPHYVRCIKPNDLHMRPIDGMLAFDAWKTYMQLLYAGVMEVCRIKKEGCVMCFAATTNMLVFEVSCHEASFFFFFSRLADIPFERAMRSFGWTAVLQMGITSI